MQFSFIISIYRIKVPLIRDMPLIFVINLLFIFVFIIIINK